MALSRRRSITRRRACRGTLVSGFLHHRLRCVCLQSFISLLQMLHLVIQSVHRLLEQVNRRFADGIYLRLGTTAPSGREGAASTLHLHSGCCFCVVSSHWTSLLLCPLSLGTCSMRSSGVRFLPWQGQPHLRPLCKTQPARLIRVSSPTCNLPWVCLLP